MSKSWAQVEGPATTVSGGEGWHDPSNLWPKVGRYQVRGLLGSGGMGVVFEAYDPELDRAVAVKVLRSRAGASQARGAARLRREGVTMARLAHPNVIRVYDVGVSDGRVFVAMELIRGCTLAAWVKRAPRPADDVLGAFVQAGRGLAAAHAAGLVHRDFKPQNVLVSDDGRVLVTDFGLARPVDEGRPSAPPPTRAPADDASLEATLPPAATPAAPAAEGDAIERHWPPEPPPGARWAAAAVITEAGAIVGTPAYMAPEQFVSGAVDARADQYSFCKALVGALTSEEWVETFTSSRAGGPAVPPEHARLKQLPRRLRAALMRGLAREPERRFPTMDELLAELEPPSKGRRWSAAAAAAGVAAIAGAVAYRGSPDPCPAPDAQVEAVWGEGRARALRQRLVAVDPKQGAARFAAAARVVEPFVREWRASHVETCRDTRVRGKQSDTLLDLRMRCLGRRLGELEGGVALLASADTAAGLDAAVGGLLRVTPLSVCADDAGLSRLMALPDDPPRRDAIEALGRVVEGVVLDQRARRLADLVGRAERAVADARRLEHPPTLAAALDAAAQVHLTVRNHDAAAAALRELVQVAASAGDSRAEARGWISLVDVVGGEQYRAAEALALLPAATAAIHRAGDALDLRVELLVAESHVLDEGPQQPQALEKLELARRLLTEPGRALGPELEVRLADIWLGIATARQTDHESGAALALVLEALTTYRRLLGPDSVDEALAQHNWGEALWRAGRPDEAMPAFEEAARINRARLGPSPVLAGNLVSIARAYGDRGDWAEALPRYQEALAMYRAHVAADSVDLAPVLTGLALALGLVERFDEAERTYAELFALLEKADAKSPNLPIALFNRGELGRRRGHCERALVDYRRAAELFETIGGSTSPYLIYPAVGTGACLVTLGRSGEAIAPLEALARANDDGDPAQVAKARAWLGRALVESRRDRARGLGLARSARTALAEAAERNRDELADLRDLERWLAERP